MRRYNFKTSLQLESFELAAMVLASFVALMTWQFSWLSLLVVLMWLFWLRQNMRSKLARTDPLALEIKGQGERYFLHYHQKTEQFDQIKVFENRWFILVRLSTSSSASYWQKFRFSFLLLLPDHFDSKTEYASIRRFLLNN